MRSTLATRRLVWSIFGSLLVFAVALGIGGAWTSDVGAEGPQVTTNKSDYAPLETAVITGSGFEPFAVLDIPVIRPDGTIVKGDGTELEGWDSVQADALGGFVYNYQLNGLEGTYTVEVYPSPWGGPGSAGVPLATTTFTDAAQFRLAQWSDVNSQWRYGNLNEQNSSYYEGESVPFMLKIETAVIGTTYDIGIRYKCDKGGKNAYDFLTRYDRNRGTAPALDPEGPGNATPDATAAINDDPSIAYDNGESDRNWKLWGAHFNSTPSGPTPSTDCPNDGEKTYNVSIQADATTVYMLWGGHLASALDWGAGLGASSIGGAPFHQGLNCPGGGICSDDRSIQGSAIGPATPQTADLKIVSMYLNNPPPSIAMSQDVQIDVVKVIHNNGPYGPVNAQTTKSATAPPNCTVSPTAHVEVISNIPVSVDLTLHEPFVIHCYAPSFHTFSFDNIIEVTTPNVTDPVPGNNSAHTELTVASIGQADVKHVSWAPVNPPSTIAVSQNVDVTFRKVFHNNGPWGPVDISNDALVWPPAGCTAVPTNVPPLVTNVPVSVDVPLDEVWTLHCTGTGTKSFAFDNNIDVVTQHVYDPDMTNNEAHRELRLEVLYGEADVKKVSLEVLSPPTDIDVSQNRPITVRGTLHNNGPAPSVDVSDTLTAVAPPDCTVNPPVSVAARTLPVSVDVTVDTVLVIHCSEPSQHTFNFDNSVVITTPGVTDPNPTNNTGSTQLSVNAWAQADLKETISVPAQIGPFDVSTENVVPLSATIHNNGPYGPVMARNKLTFNFPPDCTLKLKFPNDPNVYPVQSGVPTVTGPIGPIPVSVDVPVSVDAIIHCTDPSFHDFSGSAEILLDEVHVQDPDPSNNSDGDQRTVAFIAYADVKIASQSILSPPTDIDVSQNVPITLRKVLHNNGPYGPVEVEIQSSASAPTDCTVSPPGYNMQKSLPVSVDVTVDENFTIHCAKASTHGPFTFNNQIVRIKEPHVTDPVPGNNSASSELTVNAWAQADVKIVSQQILSPPTGIDVSENRMITLRKVLHNNGPYAVAVTSTLTSAASAPEDCTVSAPPAPQQVNLPYSTDVIVDESYTIHCTQKSTHGPFKFDNTLSAPKDAHVTDPNPTNNRGHTELTVNVWGVTDLKIVSQYVANPPTQITMSQDVLVTLNKVIHNNGPFAPVSATTNTAVAAPPDCTVSPTSHVQQYSGLPVSVDVVHAEPFVIHCYKPSFHTFTFDNTITPKDPHVRDPVSGNNTAHTELTVASVTQTDVKIVGEVFTVVPPKPMPINQDVDVTLRKTIHNNGAYGPVDVANDGKVWPSHPQICTAVPKTVPPLITGVPVSVDVSFDEVWTIRCSQSGDYSFSFDDWIDVATAHVTDSNLANNVAHLELRDDAAPVDSDGDTLTNDVDDDDDNDGFVDDKEAYVGTDPDDACADDASDAAWPLDMNNSRSVNSADVLSYAGKVAPPVKTGDAGYDRRLDLNASGSINSADVLNYAGKVAPPTSCQ